MIREAIVTTMAADDSVHIAPMGVHERGEYLVLAPFRPSRSLDNILYRQAAVVNYTDDVRIIAGCLSGRFDWPVLPAEIVSGARLRDTLSHVELELCRTEVSEDRTWLWCKPVYHGMHKPFGGFNRAQSSVLEAAILVSRLHLLPWEKIETELEYLRIGLNKTAGPHELEAWQWLMDVVEQYADTHQLHKETP